jgi:hypothetical protein
MKKNRNKKRLNAYFDASPMILAVFFVLSFATKRGNAVRTEDRPLTKSAGK